MKRNRDVDVFEQDSQPDLFGAEAAPAAYRPDLAKVRARLHKILGEARAARTFPWEPTRVSLYRTIFPQMSFFLPEEEGAVAPRIRNGNDAARSRVTAATAKKPLDNVLVMFYGAAHGLIGPCVVARRFARRLARRLALFDIVDRKPTRC